LAVYDGDELIATIASQDHADMNEILDTGVETSLAINAEAEPPTLTITLTLRDRDWAAPSQVSGRWPNANKPRA